MGVARNFKMYVLGLLFAISATTAIANDDHGSIVDKLSAVDGAQALIAALLVVDESTVLDVSIAEALDTIDGIILLAPTNPAFEALLGLEPGFLDGLSVDEIKAALPSILADLGLTISDVINILLLHVGVIGDVNESTAGVEALLAAGGVPVAGSAEPLPVSLGSKGVRINYEASVIKADDFADNGVIHFLDTVLVGDLLAQ
ncbi:MAG: fasciclin domain-containing protein [Gammaproteobacteria bacterium]|nr:fasciclin domain-containing protein [Pseudomonadales bacterium]MCP5348728.1 fasciclin domain-containing protein [Pseudomonadales bacterium]